MSSTRVTKEKTHESDGKEKKENEGDERKKEDESDGKEKKEDKLPRLLRHICFSQLTKHIINIKGERKMRIKANRMMMGASLLIMTFSLSTAANAETCQKVPTCEELGYTKTDCGTIPGLKCPFDTTKLFCGSNGNAGSSTPSTTYTPGQEVYVNGEFIGIAAAYNLIVSYVYKNMDYTNAINWCSRVTLGGKSWRLPSLSEIRRALDDTSGAVNEALQQEGGPLVTWTTDNCGGSHFTLFHFSGAQTCLNYQSSAPAYCVTDY